MHTKKVVLVALLTAIFLIGVFAFLKQSEKKSPSKTLTQSFQPEIIKSEAEWKKILTPHQFYILREKGTDPAFSEDILLHETRKGTYITADCGEPVFRSEQKFDSGTGWPSFWAPIKGSVVEIKDTSFSIERTEIVGKKCGGHLGHVFPDGPKPTGLRYCINPTSLKFIPD